MKKIIIVSILSILFNVCGCDSEQQERVGVQKRVGIFDELIAREDRNAKNIKRLEVGITKEEVIQIMGEPDKREAFGQDELWFYLTNAWVGPPRDYTPVAIRDGKVIGWGIHFIGQNKF